MCSRSPRHCKQDSPYGHSIGGAHTRTPWHSLAQVPKALRSMLFWSWLSAAAPAWAPAQHTAASQDTVPSFAGPKGSSCGTRETRTSPSPAVPALEFKASCRPCGSEGSAVGNHLQPWTGYRADGRTQHRDFWFTQYLAPLTPTFNLLLPWGRPSLGKSNQERWKGFKAAGGVLL